MSNKVNDFPIIDYTCKCGYKYQIPDWKDYKIQCPECGQYWKEEIKTILQRAKNRISIKNSKGVSESCSY